MYITEKIKFILLIALVGGMMDAYSYIVRGGVFATGQTGNFILLAINIVHFNYGKVFTYVIPILAFWIGVFFANYLVYKKLVRHKLHLQLNILIVEAILFIIVAFIPMTSNNIIANTITSFCASLQFCAFRTFDIQSSYSSVFCTGNMRSCAEAMFEWLINKNISKKMTAFKYMFILGAFFTGVILGVIINNFIGQYGSIMISLILILSILFIYNHHRSIFR